MFKSLPTRGYFFNYIQGVPKEGPRHIFCGPNDSADARCPNCNNPLLILLTLDTTETKLQLNDLPFEAMRLYFCWTCNLAQETFFYEFDRDGGIHLLEYGKGGCDKNFPYSNYPIYFPARPIALVELPEDSQEIIHGLNSDKFDEYTISKMYPELSKPKHQVGGEPYWLVGEPTTDLVCLKCSRIMPFFAAFGDDAPDDHKFTGNPYVQTLFFLCRNCLVVAAFQQTD